MKTFNVAIIIAILILALPIGQFFVSEFKSGFDLESMWNLYIVAMFFVFPLIPLIVYNHLVKAYFITSAPTLWSQISVGLLTILLYLGPTLTSLAWVFDFDGFASSDALSIIGLISLNIIYMTLSIVPGVILVKSSSLK